MSVQTLYTAATGMEALETKLDVIANNLANINTNGFKRDRANFEDLFYRQIQTPGALEGADLTSATGIEIGLGSRVSSTQTDFEQGAFEQTGNALDVAIVGKGFFPVENLDGNTVYTRSGNFSLNADGDLVLTSASAGRRLTPNIQVPQNATAVSIEANGDVTAVIDGELQTLGSIEIATFVNPDGLEKLGENLFRETLASGAVQVAPPNTDGTGFLRSGSLEASNVEPVPELINLITTQRAFELNSQVVQAGDQIMQLVSNLRRF